MFSAPPSIDAETFARLPDHYRRENARSRWLDTHLRGASRPALLEGPCFDRDGALYVVDVAFGRIFKVSAGGEFSLVIEYDGEPNGLKILADGRIIVADHANGIIALDPAGRVTPICDRPRGERFRGVNDLTLAADGQIYFTDQGQSGLHDPSGRVYRLKPDDGLELVISGIPSPNGLVLNLDESALMVAVTRDNAIWRLPFMHDGTVSKVGAFIRLSGGVGPDGVTLNADGGLTVAHIGLGAVWLFDPYGEPRLRVNTPSGRSPTNVCYGGPDLCDLYITEAESGCILRARIPYPGRPGAAVHSLAELDG
jgi:gluconolactonase